MKALAALILWTCSLAVANGTDWQVLTQWDNDLLTGHDRDYTNGARVAFLREFGTEEPAHGLITETLSRLSGAASGSAFRNWRLGDEGPLRFAAGFGVTQLMFTPDDPTAPAAPEGERPYAGWLGLEFSFHAKDDVSVSSVTLSLGTTGKPSYGRDLQKWVHEHISDSPVYQGWDSQVPAEATLNLHLDHKHALGLGRLSTDWPLQVDGYAEWGAALGNFRTDTYLGALLRAGYNLPAVFSTPRVQLGSYGHELFRAQGDDRNPFSVLGFAGARGSAVLHDITLDGPVFRDFDTGVERKPWVGEVLLGLSLRYADFELSVSRTLRSNEFKGQTENQEFGSVMVRFAAPF